MNNITKYILRQFNNLLSLLFYVIFLPMLETLFSPQSVAVIGASSDETKVGGSIFKNIISDFKGKVFPINPKRKEISGYRCYPDVHHLPESPELVIIAIPAKFIPSVLKGCGQKKVKAAIIISAGFKESGGEGRELENEIKKIGKEYGIRILGPNCLGLINTFSNLNASFAKDKPEKGEISLISQSGALCTAILDWAKLKRIGFSKFVSLGNKSDINESDLLLALKEDKTTKVICGYLEDVVDGAKFMRIAKSVSKEKPVLLMKSGITPEGIRAASSHTGSLAGSDKAYETAFKQSGVIRVYSLEELFDLAIGFCFQPLLKGNKIAIITNAGGPGIITTDSCQKEGLRLASFEKDTLELLHSHLPHASNIYNPVDILGDASASLYKLVLETVLKDRNVEGVIVLLTPQAMTEIEETGNAIVEVSQKSNKPILTSFMGEASIKETADNLRKNKIPNYSFPERATKTYGAMARYRDWLLLPEEKPVGYRIKKERVKQILNRVRKEKRVNLSSFEVKEILSNYGISCPKEKLAKSPIEAERIASEIGFPVVLKIASPEIIHKSDIGGVKFGTKKSEIKELFEVIIEKGRKHFPKAKIWGVTVQEMVKDGKEVILGMSRDLQFGPLIMFGLGGIYVEILKDISFRIAPIIQREARKMIEEIKSYPLLTGVRGEEAVNIDLIVDCLLRLSQLVVDFPEILEMDINPLKVNKKKAVAIDYRLTIKL